jgi:molecular chaperone DnaJ
MPHRITHYDTLGVERDASEADIRTAFRKLTFKHHPDRFSDEERARAEERFQGITEAFNVLTRPEAREKYDRELAVMTQREPSKMMDPKEIARRLALKGAESYREGRVQEALDHLKMAIDHDEDCERGHYYLGFALARISGRERDGLRHLERAIALDQNNATYKAEAATVCLLVGFNSRAVRFAEDALLLDPTLDKATAVLEKASAPEAREKKKDGLFGRLRRKG